MNILFFGKIVFQYLIKDLVKNNRIFFFSRKPTLKNHYTLTFLKRLPKEIRI